jgi:hypothetical protein
VKKILIIVAAMILLSGCGQRTKEILSLHNNTTGVNINVGMSKSEIDKLLGEPELSGFYHKYESAGMTIEYVDDKAVMLLTLKSEWSYRDTKILDSAEADNVAFYNDKLEETQDRDDAKYIIAVGAMNGSVFSLYIASRYD